ncbi:hypothetical protein MRB53_035551 [Persea americana]|uniref:Uncharacterized protein n=1 Tax=Persea americana TaxID=3435 RepID=A0ACC2K4Y8_PERAE|nr:hypothetical protein MRB53_035551 [Persea americana]
MYTTPISKESIVLPQVEPGEHKESSKALGLRLKAHYDHWREKYKIPTFFLPKHPFDLISLLSLHLVWFGSLNRSGAALFKGF